MWVNISLQESTYLITGNEFDYSHSNRKHHTETNSLSVLKIGGLNVAAVEFGDHSCDVKTEAEMRCVVFFFLADGNHGVEQLAFHCFRQG